MLIPIWEKESKVDSRVARESNLDSHEECESCVDSHIEWKSKVNSNTIWYLFVMSAILNSSCTSCIIFEWSTEYETHSTNI